MHMGILGDTPKTYLQDTLRTLGHEDGHTHRHTQRETGKQITSGATQVHRGASELLSYWLHLPVLENAIGSKIQQKHFPSSTPTQQMLLYYSIDQLLVQLNRFHRKLRSRPDSSGSLTREREEKVAKERTKRPRRTMRQVQ